jgi:hypothetical protein
MAQNMVVFKAENIKIADVLSAKSRCPSSLVDISVRSNLYDCLVLLRDNNIVSLPVFGEAGRWIGAGESQIKTKDGKQYIGIISVDLFF